MITQPKAENRVSYPAAPSGKWAKITIAAGAAYFAFDVIVSRIRPDYAHAPAWAPMVAIVLSTMLFMLLQVWVPRAVVGMEWSVSKTILGAVFFGSIWATASYIVPIHHIGYAVRGLTLTVSLAFLGALLSRIVREGKMLLPIAFVAMVIDVIGAMTPIGITQNIVNNHPEVIPHVFIPMPTIGVLHPLGYIGPGDALFAAFFLGVVQNKRLNMSGTFWTIFGLLTAAMLVVLTGLGDVAALLPMGIAIIAANYNYFKFDRAETFAMVYAAGIVIAVIVGMFFYTHTHVFRREPKFVPARQPSAIRRSETGAKK